MWHRKTKFMGGAGASFIINIGHCVQINLHRLVKNLLCSDNAKDMGLAHEARADNPDRDFLFLSHFSASLLTINRRSIVPFRVSIAFSMQDKAMRSLASSVNPAMWGDRIALS
ncbi:MAG: hypothetical protein ACI9LZ_003960 [Glaciecola sp.]|jgi:hypothetical protein